MTLGDIRTGVLKELIGTNASKVVAAAHSMLRLINRPFRHIEIKPFMIFFL